MKFEGTESGQLEFKRELPSKKQIVKTVIGFCNLHGGRIIIGVNDNGDIIGVNEEEISCLADTLQVHRRRLRIIFYAFSNPCTPSE